MSHSGFFRKILDNHNTYPWINSAILDDIESSIQMGAVGCTSNPTHPPRAVKKNPELWLPVIDLQIKENPKASDARIVEMFTENLARVISEKFLEMYEESHHQYGYCAAQGNPFYIDNTEAMIDYAITFSRINPNVIGKIPSSVAGLQAVEELTSRGIHTVCTMGFSVSQNIAFAEAYYRGLARLKARVQEPKSYMVIIPGIFDDYMEEKAKLINLYHVSPEAFRFAGTAVVRRSYEELQKRGLQKAALFVGGTRKTYHITDYIGDNVHITHSINTWEQLYKENPDITPCINAPIPDQVIEELLEKFDDYHYAYEPDALAPVDFEKFGPCLKFNNSCKESFVTLMDIVKERRNHH